MSTFNTHDTVYINNVAPKYKIFNIKKESVDSEEYKGKPFNYISTCGGIPGYAILCGKNKEFYYAPLKTLVKENPEKNITTIKKAKCIDKNLFDNNTFLEGKIYDVLKKYHDPNLILVKNEYGNEVCCDASSFKEVEEDNEESFKFIPLTEVEYITINGVKGILVKE